MSSQPESIKEAIDEIAAESPGAAHAGWLLQHQVQPSDRADVLRNVMFDSDPRWLRPFVFLLIMSTGVATLGLSQDSAAVVIGAMAIAPLGQAMAALGAAIAVVWPREALRMLAVTLGGAVLVVGVAFLIGVLLPIATPNAQILARTSPDLRDLGVALFAGAAGAYAQTRRGLISALTGVAIAVALVPPLATVGLMLEEHRFALAKGATVLFGANLVGIALSTTVVLLATRYAPLPRWRVGGWRAVVPLIAALALAVVVMIPLARTYSTVLNDSSLVTAVNRQVVATLGPNTGVVVGRVIVKSNGVTIDLIGSGAVPPASVFAADLVDELGPDVSVTINRE